MWTYFDTSFAISSFKNGGLTKAFVSSCEVQEARTDKKSEITIIFIFIIKSVVYNYICYILITFFRKNTMLFIRSLLFSIFFWTWVSLVTIGLTPFAIVKSRRIANFIAILWAIGTMTIFKYVCRVDYEIRGLENLKKGKNYIIASKHQSMWETAVMYKLFKEPIYIIKKELTLVPFFGFHVKRANHIVLDRGGAAKALRSVIKQAKFFLDKGQNVIIFPQGTRTPVGATTKEYPYKSGIAGIHSITKYPVLPMALNSGLFWGKRSFIKKSGKIIVEFMEPIEYTKDFNKQKFMKILEDRIEKKTNEIVKESMNSKKK
jgi:1-acyl-sn-glycerol-3-phosphate acyltransferase